MTKTSPTQPNLYTSLSGQPTGICTHELYCTYVFFSLLDMKVKGKIRMLFIHSAGFTSEVLSCFKCIPNRFFHESYFDLRRFVSKKLWEPDSRVQNDEMYLIFYHFDS
jgi:hypothetical protein